MDAFFASVEQRDHPELRGKPVAVGGSGNRGVVAAASYEARKYGVRSAMSSKIALRLCPELIFVRGNFDQYSSVSKQIRNIFWEYSDLVEPLSLDEAYLDVTQPKLGPPSATIIAQEIRRRIFEETGLTASAGISYCKFLAKMASGMNKPNGQKLILPEEAEAFLEGLAVEKFHGVGKATAEKMRKMGILYGRDLKKRSLEELGRRFGKIGKFYYNIVRGIDNRAVQPIHVRKSVGAERTFAQDLDQLDALHQELSIIADILAERLRRNNNGGRTITLKVKYADFRIVSRSRTVERDICAVGEMLELVKPLLLDTDALSASVRLLGLSISNLKSEREAYQWRVGSQLELPFEEGG